MSECAGWPPPRRSKPLVVAIPGSVIGVEPGLESKTFKAGIIARLLAVFRVDEVVVYRDPDTKPDDARLLSLLLKYSATPPHLKKKLFGLSGELRYAGLLPPLKIPSHIVPEEPVEGSVLDGYVEECSGSECRVYLGRLGYGILREGRLRKGSIVTVRIDGVRGGAIILERASWGDTYSGFKVSVISELRRVLARYRSRGMILVGTSRYGECLSETHKELVASGVGVLVIFGGPRRGILEFTRLEDYDIVINAIPYQGTLTVRTEEALAIVLSRLFHA